MAEEALLQRHAIVGVEFSPVFAAMHLQPLLPGGRAYKALDIAAQVQTVATPVRRRQQRHIDPIPQRRALCVIVVHQRPGQNVGAKITAVCRQLRVSQGVGAADGIPGYDAARPALTTAMLDRRGLLRIPVGKERAGDAAVMTDVAIKIGSSFPDADRGQMRWPQRGDMPLIHAIIGDPVQADLAA